MPCVGQGPVCCNNVTVLVQAQMLDDGSFLCVEEGRVNNKITVIVGVLGRYLIVKDRLVGAGLVG